ncbi:hypothetical protein Ancab_012174 [Ancistrocladus abbreviatus]
MEATREEHSLLDKIRPPRLEDAGLEDCALPPDSIKEAFFKAASAVSSRTASVLFHEEGEDEERGCVNDPWPTTRSPTSDAVVGLAPEANPPESCIAEKGGALIGERDGAGDLVGERNAAEEEDENNKDEVVVVGGGGQDGEFGKCVDGLQGLEIGGKGKREKKEENDEKPTLIEDYF